MQAKGLWTDKKLAKKVEEVKAKAHWDFVLEEMTWLSDVSTVLIFLMIFLLLTWLFNLDVARSTNYYGHVVVLCCLSDLGLAWVLYRTYLRTLVRYRTYK